MLIHTIFALFQFTVIQQATYRNMYSLLKRINQLQGCFLYQLAIINFLLLLIAEHILSLLMMRDNIGTGPLFEFGIIKEDLIVRPESGWLLMVRDMCNVIQKVG